MCECKSFHIHAPVTGKARRPTIESLTAGTDRLSVVEDRSHIHLLSHIHRYNNTVLCHHLFVASYHLCNIRAYCELTEPVPGVLEEILSQRVDLNCHLYDVDAQEDRIQKLQVPPCIYRRCRIIDLYNYSIDVMCGVAIIDGIVWRSIIKHTTLDDNSTRWTVRA